MSCAYTEEVPVELLAVDLFAALEWVMKQNRLIAVERGHVPSDPNRLDDEQCIVRLIGQVITVSLETRRITRSLPELRCE